jgi:ATP adenylyltransferase
MSECLFCKIPQQTPAAVIAENSLAYVIHDTNPVTPYHTLVMPKRCVETYFDLTDAEVLAIFELIGEQKLILDKTDPTIDGYNIGMNCGKAAGQTIFHCHVHIIPRRSGDTENPRGGIRHVIRGKGNY